MRGSATIAMAFLLLCVPMAQSQESGPANLRTVEHFVAAFNAHDVEAMGALVTADISWLSLDGGVLAVESSDKRELIADMHAYFKSCPTCRSSLSATVSTPERVSAVEIASWQGKTGAKSQTALSVYEFSEGLIHRVYYFPAER